MSIHGCSYAEYAEMYSRISLKESRYLGLRDVPDLLQKYAKGNMALDYGCGLARSSAFLTNLGFLVDGVDISESMINLARQAMPEGSFQVLQEDRIPAENEHYDLVFCSWVLQEISSKHKLIATLSEITRVLKKDGIFAAIVPSEALYTKDWIHANAEFEENKHLKSGDQAKILVKESNFFWRHYFWTETDYRDVLREVRLDVILLHRPLGKDDDGIAWVSEKEVAPVTIFVAKKI